jgi:hypothetical protein
VGVQQAPVGGGVQVVLVQVEFTPWNWPPSSWQAAGVRIRQPVVPGALGRQQAPISTSEGHGAVAQAVPFPE